VIWTSEPPTEPGWYWTKRKGCHPGVTCFISYGVLTGGAYTGGVTAWDGAPIDSSEFELFAGPLVPPSDPE